MSPPPDANSIVDWNRPLQFRRGSPKRLGGIALFYDFDWLEVFPDRRAQFRNGMCLSRLVRADCPAGKTPALLLTTQGDVEEHTIETETHFVAVVNLPHYLSRATPDPAASYFAHQLDSGITRIGQLHEIAAQPDVIRAVVSGGLTSEHIAAWAGQDPERLAALRAIAGGVVDSTGHTAALSAEVSELASRPDVIRAVVEEHLDLQHILDWASAHEDQIGRLRAIAGAPSEDDEIDPARAIRLIEGLESLDEEVVEAIEGLLGRDMDREARLRFLRALTADKTGRDVTSQILGQRIADRLTDARDITIAYNALLSDPRSSETSLQRFIEGNPWLLGLDYVRVRARRGLPRGVMDFILERYDGFHDVLELKSPQDPVIVAPDQLDGIPPPANTYALSPDLSRALAQIHVYRDVLSTDVGTMGRLYGLKNARYPRMFIVIGQMRLLPPHRARVLRDLNLSLHRVEVVPYDILGTRAETILDNVERHLSASRDS